MLSQRLKLQVSCECKFTSDALKKLKICNFVKIQQVLLKNAILINQNPRYLIKTTITVKYLIASNQVISIVCFKFNMAT